MTTKVTTPDDFQRATGEWTARKMRGRKLVMRSTKNPYNTRLSFLLKSKQRKERLNRIQLGGEEECIEQTDKI